MFRSANDVVMTQGGLETTVEYLTNFPMREFATFELLASEKWSGWLSQEQEKYGSIAMESVAHTCLIDAATWRASSDWFDKLGLTTPDRDEHVANAAMDHVRQVCENISTKCAGKIRSLAIATIGPRRDAYKRDELMTVNEAREYHCVQIKALAAAGAELFGAYTLTNSAEAIGIALEVQDCGIPLFLSFTLADDDRLPSGETLGDAITAVDASCRSGAVLFYMLNCIHPARIRRILQEAKNSGSVWLSRIKGARGNASAKSHADLDGTDKLDEGDPDEWSHEMATLHREFPEIQVLGGCCGTGPEHLKKLASIL
jgi:S-methylmethionine-dependent homocysteine/selenocysteine methylase